MSPKEDGHPHRSEVAVLSFRRRDHEEFEVETDVAGEWPVPFCSETVRRVVVE